MAYIYIYNAMTMLLELFHIQSNGRPDLGVLEWLWGKCNLENGREIGDSNATPV